MSGAHLSAATFRAGPACQRAIAVWLSRDRATPRRSPLSEPRHRLARARPDRAVIRVRSPHYCPSAALALSENAAADPIFLPLPVDMELW
jgi:hypothetical protein